MTGTAGGKYYAGAATLAINDINADLSLMRGRRLEYIWADSGCNSITSVEAAQELLHAEVHGIIGAACSSACEPAAFLTAARGLPQVPLFAERLSPHDCWKTMVTIDGRCHMVTPLFQSLGMVQLQHYPSSSCFNIPSIVFHVHHCPTANACARPCKDVFMHAHILVACVHTTIKHLGCSADTLSSSQK